MNPTIKQEWIETLKSGKYEQGFGTLRKKNKMGQEFFCCLGVLCMLYDEKTNTDNWGRGYAGRMLHMGRAGTPQRDVETWADLDGDKIDKVATWNDSGKSFNWIASYIKRYL